MPDPKKWLNPLTFIVLAVLVALQMALQPEAWSIVMALGVALGAVLLATVMPYARKVLQGKASPAFKARFSITAIAGQGVAYYFLSWCVEVGLLSTASILVILVISVLAGFACTAMMNYCLAWFRGPLAEDVEKVATFWLVRLLVARGFDQRMAQAKVAELMEALGRLMAERGAG